MIAWFLDPTVAARARYGNYMAEVWGTGDGAGFAVFAFGAHRPLAQGTAANLDEARARAEDEIRRRISASASGHPEWGGKRCSVCGGPAVVSGILSTHRSTVYVHAYREEVADSPHNVIPTG